MAEWLAARLDLPARLDAGEVRRVMGQAAGCPELAVAYAIDRDLDLPPHRFRNGWRNLRSDYRRVRYHGAGKPPRHVLSFLGWWQPANMRGSDPRLVGHLGRGQKDQIN